MLWLFTIFFSGALGLSVGSFLNAMIWRLHAGKSLIRGRSRCPQCSHVLAWKDLFPLLSFVMLKGKCRYCKKLISRQYPLLEAITSLLFVITFMVFAWQHGWWSQDLGEITLSMREVAELLRNWFFVSVLLLIFVYDLRWYLILDVITLPAIVVSYVINGALWYVPLQCSILPLLDCVSNASWTNLLLAGSMGAGFFALQYVISQGKWIGGGDVRLGALMGVMLGWPLVLAALMLAYVGGAFVSVVLIAMKKKTMASEVPFGTFLSVATLTVLLFSPQVSQFIATYLMLR